MSERRQIRLEVENLPLDLESGLSSARRGLRRLTRLGLDVGDASLTLVEQQVDSLIKIGERLRDDLVDPETVEKARGEGMVAAFRGDAHRLVDVAGDFTAQLLYSAANLLDEVTGAEKTAVVASPGTVGIGSREKSDLTVIEGIGNVYAARFQAAGVYNLEQLLEAGATRQGRQTLAEQTNISAKRILTWVNHADLQRIDGVGEEYSELLELAGVDSVPELAQRNPNNLHTRLAEINAEQKRVRHLPSVTQVAAWVDQARKLPRAVTH